MQSLRSIAAALGGDVISNRYVLCPGPSHSRKDRSLKVTFRDDGTFTVTSFADDDWRECKDYIRERLDLPNDCRRAPSNDNVSVVRSRDRDGEEHRDRTTRDGLLRWKTAIPIAGTLAAKYLASRDLQYGGDVLRYRANDRTMLAHMTSSIRCVSTVFLGAI